MNINPTEAKDDLIHSNCEASEDSSTYSEIDQHLDGPMEESESRGLGTFGTSGIETPYFYTLANDIDIFNEAVSGLHVLSNPEVKEETLSFLRTFQKLIMIQRNKTEFSGHLPPLKFRPQEDNSVLLEWIFRDFRIGFAFEPKLRESSWYLVSNERLNEASASGLLNKNELEPLLSKLIPFALKNV
jgi:hypothetical protein